MQVREFLGQKFLLSLGPTMPGAPKISEATPDPIIVRDVAGRVAAFE
jgi:hypothetical protein